MLAPLEELSNYEIAFVFIAFPHGTVPIKRTTYKKSNTNTIKHIFLDTPNLNTAIIIRKLLNIP